MHQGSELDHDHFCPNCGFNWECQDYHSFMFQDSVCDYCLEVMVGDMEHLYDTNIGNN